MERQNSRFNEAVSEMQQRLKGPDQSEMFAGRVDVLRLQFQEALIDHITKENEAYETETFESKVQMDQLIIGKRWDKPNQLKNKVGEVIRDITKRGQETGKHKDTIDVDIIKAVSPSIYTAIANAVDAGQADHARELLHGDGKKEEGYAALMTSKDILDAEKLIKEGGLLERAYANVDGYEDAGLSAREIDEAIKQIENPEERAKTRIIHNNQIVREEKLEKEEQDAAREEAYGYWSAGSTYEEIPESVIARMNKVAAKELELAMRRAQKGVEVVTDRDFYGKWFRKATSPRQSDREEFRSVDFANYPSKLEMRHYEFFVKLQADQKVQAKTSSLVQKKKMVFSAAGEDWNALGKKNAKGKRAGALNARIDQELQAAQAAQDAIELTDEQESEIINNLSTEILREMPWYRRDQEFVAAEATLEQTRGIPVSEIDEYVGEIQDALGADHQPTMEEISILRKRDLSDRTGLPTSRIQFLWDYLIDRDYIDEKGEITAEVILEEDRRFRAQVPQ
jgi:hypothetical protein